MDSESPLKSTSTHNSHNFRSYERFSGVVIISWILVDLPLNSMLLFPFLASTELPEQALGLKLAMGASYDLVHKFMYSVN